MASMVTSASSPVKMRPMVASRMASRAASFRRRPVCGRRRRSPGGASSPGRVPFAGASSETGSEFMPDSVAHLTRLCVSAILAETVILGNEGRRHIMLDGQNAVVVGGSRGIGESVAGILAGRGKDVLITGRAKERLDAAVDRIRKSEQVTGGAVAVEAHELDATDADAVAEFFARVGAFDHLVLAASPGAIGSGPFASLDEAALRAAFDGKFFAHFNVLRAAQAQVGDDHHRDVRPRGLRGSVRPGGRQRGAGGDGATARGGARPGTG